MKKISMAWAVAAALAVPVAATAAPVKPGFYIGGSYVFADVEDNGSDLDVDLDALMLRAGFQLNEYIAIEGRVGEGVQDDEVFGVKVELEEMYGAYVKAGLPTQTGFYPYALLGVTRGEISARGPGGRVSETDSDISYGVGVDYWFSGQLSGSVEYTQFYDKDSSVSGLSLGVNYKF